MSGWAQLQLSWFCKFNIRLPLQSVDAHLVDLVKGEFHGDMVADVPQAAVGLTRFVSAQTGFPSKLQIASTSNSIRNYIQDHLCTKT